MPATSTTIMSNQTHPGDSTSTTVTGDKFKGDGYYGRSDGFHTVQMNVNGVAGTIQIQGTLATTPAEADYFNIAALYMIVQLPVKMVLLFLTLQETLSGLEQC